MSNPDQSALEARFSNRDGVGLIAERLDQAQLSALAQWFFHGCAAGRNLLLYAPLFDTLLQRTVDKFASSGCLHCAQRALFVHGLVLAVHLRESLERPELGRETVPLSGVLDALSGPAVDIAIAIPQQGSDPAFHPLRFLGRLERLDSRVSLILEAVGRLENGLGGNHGYSPFGGDHVPPSPRFAFFAGLIAGGIEFDWCPSGQCSPDECEDEFDEECPDDGDEEIGAREPEETEPASLDDEPNEQRGE